MTRKTGKFKNRTAQKMFAVITLLLTNAALYAQSGEEGLNQAAETVKGYFDEATLVLYAIGAVVGLVGAIKVYNKWNSGDQDTSKVAASWFGSCIFLVVVATVLKAFFGV